MSFLKETLKASVTACTLAFASASVLVGSGLTENSIAQAQTISASQFIINNWDSFSQTRQIRHITNNVDFNTFSRLVVGPEWRSATESQRQRFQDAFEDYLISEYGRQLRKYAGGNITNITERTNRNGYITVEAEIEKAGRNPLSLEFSMYPSGNGWRIYNMKVEGFLLSRHFRSEFGRIMDREGGLDGLINYLDRNAFLDNRPNFPDHENHGSERIFVITRDSENSEIFLLPENNL